MTKEALDDEATVETEVVEIEGAVMTPPIGPVAEVLTVAAELADKNLADRFTKMARLFPRTSYLPNACSLWIVCGKD